MLTEFVFDCGEKFHDLVNTEVQRSFRDKGTPKLILQMKHGEPALIGKYTLKRPKGLIINPDPKMGGKGKGTITHFTMLISDVFSKHLDDNKPEKFIIRRYLNTEGQRHAIHEWSWRFDNTASNIECPWDHM